ncbi:MAG: hypothetical protein FJ006_12155 [Chloroflexi bacterium]|nr:hypothetical protein [Chloroflexota bacterium]
MFDYLCHKVKPTGDSVQVMVDKELPELVSRVRGDSPDDDLARLCLEIDRGSTWLGKAVRAGGIAFVNSYKDSYPDVSDELWPIFQVWSAASILAVLRLVERELEADDLAQKLGIKDK